MANSGYDIIIIGAGLNGLTAAIGLAQQGFRVAAIDRQPLAAQHEETYDGRASAIAHASCKLFEGIGLWPHLADHAQPINEIRVSDGPSLLHLHFDHRELADGPLGHMLENRHIRLALAARVAEMDGLDIVAPAEVAGIDYGRDQAVVRLAGAEPLTAPLVLAADGRMSKTRERAGIGITGWGYGQVGIVCSIAHEHDHLGIAHERFLPAGPFAILPLYNRRASLVWTEETRFAEAIMALGPRAFKHEVATRVGDFLGDIEIVGGRWCYPLTLQFADRYRASRLALLGDSVHGIHPIAGQGLNMGLRDSAALIEVLTEARRTGEDIGSAAVLERYARWRRSDNATLMAVTDVLNRLFSNAVPPVRLARDLGIAAVNRIPPLRRFFMQHARGTVGSLPRLLRGETL